MGPTRDFPRKDDIADELNALGIDVVTTVVVVSALVGKLTNDWVCVKTYISNELSSEQKGRLTRRHKTTKEVSDANDFELAIISLWKKLTGVDLHYNVSKKDRRNTRWWFPFGAVPDDTTDPEYVIFGKRGIEMKDSFLQKMRDRVAEKKKPKKKRPKDFDAESLYAMWEAKPKRKR